MRFANAKEVIQHIEHVEKSAEPMRRQLAERLGIDGCYYEQVQWIQRYFNPGYLRTTSITRLPVDWNPNSNDLRAVSNEVSKLTQKAAAGTHPDQIYMDVEPPPRDSGTEASYRARTHEIACNAAIDASGYLYSAQDGSFDRTIFGTALVGLALEATDQGQYLCAFTAQSTCLITEPAIQKRHLFEHPFVIYSDVWDLERIERTFGLKIEPGNAKTFEQLDPQKIEVNALSANKLFSRYAQMSQAKGARIYQMHVKDGDRFPTWYICVEAGDGKKTLVNENNDATPFGGMGMPFALLHGYRRADTMWSWGEPAQLKDDQDKLNLDATIDQRIKQNYAHSKWIVDKRWFNGQPSDDDIAKYTTNQVGGIIPGGAGDRARNVQPPSLVPMPPPPPWLSESMSGHRALMREKIHKAPGNFGETPTHVPFKTTERVLDDADQVTSVRVAGDVIAHQYLIGVLHATTIKLAQERNTPTVAMLRKAGFDGQDFAVLLEADPTYLPVTLSVREGSFRNVSTAARKANLDNAASLQMIDKDDYQQAMADTLQLPLTEEARQMADYAKKEALKVLFGAEWLPKPLGRWNKIVIESFIRAQADRRATDDPAALQRLGIAIQSQQEMWGREQVASNPELQAKLAQGGGTPTAEQAQSPEPNQSASVADILSALSSGSGPGNVAGQTASAA